ncbi:unnamed protein product [Closterium sp. NIES-53]
MATPRVLRFDAEGRPLEFSVWLLRARRLLESQVQAHETLWAHVRTASEFLTAIKARYATPTIVSLGRLFLPFLFPDLASFERTTDLITHLCSLDSSYRAACTDAQLALLPPPMAITIYFIATSLPYRLASVHDTLFLKHPSELTIKVLESALKDVESNLHSVASASGVVPPPLFHGCTVPQLPTFTASLATAAIDVTAVAVTTSSRSQGRSGRRGGQGSGGGGGGGGGDVASGGGGSAGAGGAPRAAAGDSPAAAGGGDAQVPIAAAAAAAPPLVAPTAAATAAASFGAGVRTASAAARCCPPSLIGARRGQPCGRSRPPGQCFAQLTDMVRLAYDVDSPAPDWLPLVQMCGLALWGMSTSLLVNLLGTPHAMYIVVDSSASDSVYSSLVSLGASLAEVPVASVGTCVDTSPGAPPEDASLSFTLDSGASHCFFRDRTTLTPLPTTVSVALADPTSGPVTARYTTTLPCLDFPSSSLTVFHVPSFSRNLVGVRPLMSQHGGVWIEPSGETAVCVDRDTYTPLATFTAEPGSGLYTLHTGPRGQQQQHQQLLPPTPVTGPRQAPASHQVAASPQVAVSGQVPVSGPVAASCSCRSLAHPTVLWHHRMGHPSISRLRVMSSQCLVLGLPRILPSLPPSLAPPFGPCVEGRLRATPHSSLRSATEPFKTLHLDVWGPASRPGPERESFFLVVVDDCSRYTTVFPLAKKSDVTSTLIRWLLTTADTRARPVSCLHSDRGGEFCSGVLAGFCREQGIHQSWTLPESPQLNGVAERCIGLVIEIARTSMTHACAPRFLWPYAVRYAAHQLNLWPRVSWPEVSPTSLWTGSPGAASRFRVWGCLALVRNNSADKISPCAVPCVFLGFPEDSSDYTVYHPPLHRFFYSRDLRFDESVPYYVRYPCRGLPIPPPPLFLTSAPPPAPSVKPPPPGPAPSDPAGADFRGEDPGGASSREDSSLRGAGVSGAVLGGATTWGAPSAGPGEPGTDPVTSGGAGSGGGAIGSLESGPGATTARDTTPPPYPYPTRHQACVRRALAAVAAAAGGAAVAAAAGAAGAATSSSSCLWSSDPQSPLSSSIPPSPVSDPLLPPPDPSPAVFPPPLPPLSPPLSQAWPSCRSPRARPSVPIILQANVPQSGITSGPLTPFTNLRTALFRSSPPRSSPSVLPSPPELALTASLSTPVTNYYRTYRPDLSRVLAYLVIDPRAFLSSVSALTATVTEFASTLCLDYATSLVAAPPTNPLAVRDESALGCNALEDRQFELEFLAAASPHLCAMLLAPWGDPDALDIPTPCTYAKAVSGPWASQVKRPPGSPPVFKARYVARSFSQREGVDFFQTFAPTPKMTTLWVLLHVAAQRDYELHSLEFSTAFLQGSLHEEVWLRRPSPFTGNFPPGTLWRLRRTPLAVDHRLTGPFLDESFEPSGPYAELVGCLMVAKYLATTSGVGLVLGGRQDVVLTGHRDSSYADDAETHRSTQGYCFSLGSGAVSWRSTRSSSVSTSTAEAEIYAGAMAAQELRWLAFFLTDLGERPSSAPTLFADNKTTILLCREPRLESRVKHINVR